MEEYCVGQEFAVKVKIVEVDRADDPAPYRVKVDGNDDGVWLSEAELSAAIVTPPTLAPDGWTPRVGERVLVEGVISSKSEASGNSAVMFHYDGTDEMDYASVSTKYILGPAPVVKRPYNNGDDVFYLPEMLRCKVAWCSTDGDIDLLVPGTGREIGSNVSEIISLAEARERLAK